MQGLQAGARIAEQLSGSLEGFLRNDQDGADRTSTRSDDSTEARETVGELRSTVARMVDLYSDLLLRSFDAYGDLIERRAGADPSMNGGARRGVVIETKPGSQAEGDLWIHNHVDHSGGPYTLKPTALSSAVGGSIAADAVVLTPPFVEKLDARSTQRITVTVVIPDEIAPGHYHGHVLTEQLPGEAVPLLLVVTDGTNGGQGP
jgi:hypothetical protein